MQVGHRPAQPRAAVLHCGPAQPRGGCATLAAVEHARLATALGLRARDRPGRRSAGWIMLCRRQFRVCGSSRCWSSSAGWPRGRCWTCWQRRESARWLGPCTRGICWCWQAPGGLGHSVGFRAPSLRRTCNSSASSLPASPVHRARGPRRRQGHRGTGSSLALAAAVILVFLGEMQPLPHARRRDGQSGRRGFWRSLTWACC